MFKKFFNGLVFGCGFSIAVIAVFVIYFKFFFEDTINSSLSKKENLVTEVPEVPKITERFLGSSGIYAGGFRNNNSGMLSPGPGEIKGLVTSNGDPTEGLRLRLALNGKVMSQWSTTNFAGEYRISVPFGEYKIDGYELDTKTANMVLKGLITSPVNAHTSSWFTVTENAAGIGIDFRFIKPVVKKTLGQTFSIIDPIVISWEPYKDAERYSIQVFEKVNPHDYSGPNSLFMWSERPEVASTSLDLKTVIKELKPNHYYTYEVRAIDKNGLIISETPSSHQGYDFRISET